MSRGSKIILGILSFLPFVLLVFYLGAVFSFVGEMIVATRAGEKPDAVFVWTRMSTVILMAIVLGLVALGLKIYYIIHAINNKSINSSEKIVWILVFVFVGLIGYPIYYITRILKEPENTVPTS